jgi:hypothetical protein
VRTGLSQAFVALAFAAIGTTACLSTQQAERPTPTMVALPAPARTADLPAIFADRRSAPACAPAPQPFPPCRAPDRGWERGPTLPHRAASRPRPRLGGSTLHHEVVTIVSAPAPHPSP